MKNLNEIWLKGLTNDEKREYEALEKVGYYSLDSEEKQNRLTFLHRKVCDTLESEKKNRSLFERAKIYFS